jgi:hypothetical protein
LKIEIFGCNDLFAARRPAKALKSLVVGNPGKSGAILSLKKKAIKVCEIVG